MRGASQTAFYEPVRGANQNIVGIPVQSFAPLIQNGYDCSARELDALPKRFQQEAPHSAGGEAHMCRVDLQ